jgi:hypothetical protein
MILPPDMVMMARRPRVSYSYADRPAITDALAGTATSDSGPAPCEAAGPRAEATG